MKRNRIKASNAHRQQGWGATEYLAVLLGLMTVWRGAQGLLELLQQHHDVFSWALMMPF